MNKLYSLILALLTMATIVQAQTYPPTSYQIEGNVLKQWRGTETHIDFTTDPALRAVRTIDTKAFDNNHTLISVKLSKQIERVLTLAFSNCSALQEVVFEDRDYPDFQTLRLEDPVFDRCSQLQRITLPIQFYVHDTAHPNLGMYFDRCPALTAVNIAQGHASLRSEQGIVYDKTLTRLHYLPSGIGGDVTLRSSVKSLSRSAFYQSKLTSLFLPSMIDTIPEGCFEAAEQLKTIVLPRQLLSIGQRAFADCKSLKSLFLPNGLQEIGSYAFWGCTALPQTIKFPQSLQHISGNAFARCPQVSRFEIADGGLYRSTEGVLFSADASKLVLVPALTGAYRVPEGVLTIGKETFTRSQVEEILLPASLRHIEERAFYACDSLKRIVIPEGVESIGRFVLAFCVRLEHIDLPTTLQDIGSQSFARRQGKGKGSILCRAIYPPAIPEEDAPYDTLYVPAEAVDVYKIAPYWKRFAHILPIPEPVQQPKYVLSEDKTRLLRWHGDESAIYFSDYPELASVRSIAAGAFAHNTTLQHLVADNVTQIESAEGSEQGAFEAASALRDLNLPALNAIGRRAFAQCIGLESLPYFSYLTTIEEAAFQACTSLQALMLSPDVSYIGHSVFEQCTALQALTCFAMTPPRLGNNVFQQVDVTGVKLNVPTEAEAAYASVPQWSRFFLANSIAPLRHDVSTLPTTTYFINGVKSPTATPRGWHIRQGKLLLTP